MDQTLDLVLSVDPLIAVGEESNETNFGSEDNRRGMGTRWVPSDELGHAEVVASVEAGVGNDATKKGGNEDSIV